MKLTGWQLVALVAVLACPISAIVVTVLIVFTGN